MAKEANRMMIGGFVVAAVFLLVASIVVFGSGRFFKKTETFVLNFDGSIKGLNVGSTVLFQGVQIGSVSKIMLLADGENLKTQIPVYIEIQPEKFQVVGKQREKRDPNKSLPILIDNGLRAVLGLESYITGQLMIQLDFYPGTPVNLKKIDSEYLEIPTIQSTTERMYQTLQDIDFKGLVNHMVNTLAGVDSFVNNPDWDNGLQSLKVAADELRNLIGKIDNRIDPLIDSFEGTLGDTRKLVTDVDKNIEPLAQDLKKAVEDFDSLTITAKNQLEKLVKELDVTLAGINGVVSEDATMVISLEETLIEISAMASSIRQLADYLERHPEALLQGKSKYGGE